MSQRFGYRRGAARSGVTAPGDRKLAELGEVVALDEDDLDFPMEELQEFLSADLFDVPADPTFKEGLREKLWELVQSGSFGYGRTRGH